MADPAVLSVIFTGTVGVMGAATAATGNWLTARNEERKRQEARREDLRDVLDEAAKSAMIGHRSVAPDLTCREMADLLRDAQNAATDQLARIGVRRGPDAPLYREYERIELRLARLEEAMGVLPPEVPFTAVQDALLAGRLAGGLTAAQIEHVRLALDESAEALQSFLSQAHRVVGQD
jgi:hypothetical protein